jgi:hypothetical protein
LAAKGHKEKEGIGPYDPCDLWSKQVARETHERVGILPAKLGPINQSQDGAKKSMGIDRPIRAQNRLSAKYVKEPDPDLPQ